MRRILGERIRGEGRDGCGSYFGDGVLVRKWPLDGVRPLRVTLLTAANVRFNAYIYALY